MEPFEWLILGIGLAAGGLIGARGREIMGATVRITSRVTGCTREWMAGRREDVRDTIEEARYETERESARAGEVKPKRTYRKRTKTASGE